MTIISITKPTTTQIQTTPPELDKPLQPIPTKEIAPLPPIDKANDHSAYTTMKNNLFAGAMAGVVADSKENRYRAKLGVCLSIYSSNYKFIYLSVHQIISLPIDMFICLSV